MKRPYLKRNAYFVYRRGLPVSDLEGNYYEIGVGRVLDWGIDEAWSGGGWITFLRKGKLTKMSLGSVLGISDHYVTVEEMSI